MTMSGANGWLKAQRKADLVELAEEAGIQEYEGLKKSELELVIDEHLSENASQFAGDPRFAPFFTSRTRAAGSPVKKEAPELRVARRRTTKPAEEAAPADDDEEPQGQSATAAAAATATAARDLVARTPGRALRLAQRIPLPATPADVADAVDRGTVAVRERVSSLYLDSGLPEAAQATRQTLSTVAAVQLVVATLELASLQPEVLANRYAFTVPAVGALGTPDYPVHVPDLFLLLTSSFWSPVLTWLLTACAAPAVVGYFFNLSAASHASAGGHGRGRPRMTTHAPEYTVDPLTFSIAKAVITYVVYAQGVTLGGWIDPIAVARINSALFQEWRSVIAGTAITAVTALYEAILKK